VVAVLTDDVYPVEHLKGLSTAFVGFAGGNEGRQDCQFIAAAGLEAVCVEKEPERLETLSGLFPDGWQFVQADVYEYAKQRYAQGARWDVVSLDPYTNQFQEAADEIPLWCSIARKIVILGSGLQTRRRIPDGWKVAGRWTRSSYQGGTYWIVLKRAK
jgi:hypothetical protein